MRAPDGQGFCSKGVYREIVKHELLVMTDSFADKEGNTVPPTYYGMDADFPGEMLITVTFEERDNRTKLIVKHSNIKGLSEAGLNDMQQGWGESLDKLAELLAEI